MLNEGDRLLRWGVRRAPQESSGLPVRATVDVLVGWSVGDVLQAAGYYPHNSFALVTPKVEADPELGHEQSITAVHNLLGVDADGVARFDASQFILWEDFVRAVKDGLYVGDPSRIIGYEYGSAGGLSPDGLWEAVQFS